MQTQKKILISLVSFMFFSLFLSVILFMIHVKKTDSIILIDDLTCFYREKINVSHFIDKMDGELLDDYLVDTSLVGRKRIEIQYKNRYGFVEQKRFDIEVIDDVAPVIVVNNPYIVKVGELSNLSDNIFCADDYDDNIKCRITGDYDLNKEGSYSLYIDAVDKSGNRSHQEFVLKVTPDGVNSNKVKDSIDFKNIYQKYKNNNTEIGIDVSKWQGEIDFAKVRQAGVSFVMIKIGGQEDINSNIVMDPYFEENIKKAIDNNLKVGVYFYSHAKNEDNSRKQARWVVQMLKKYQISLPVVFDWENWEHISRYGIGFRSLNKIASVFIDEVNRNHYEGMLYSSKFYLENVWYHESYNNWLAYYTDNNDYQGKYSMWQVCDNARVDGIDENVDVDVLFKEK